MKNTNSNQLFCSFCGIPAESAPNKEGVPFIVRTLGDNLRICNCCVLSLENSLKQQLYHSYCADSFALSDFRLDLDAIIYSVQRKIINQDETIKKVATAIYKNITFKDPAIKSNIIIMGNTGTGKTAIVSELAKLFDVPYAIVDATDFSETGYVGREVNDMITDLIHKAGNDIHAAEQGILIIDEGDKKRGNQSSGRDVSGENVLLSMLKILEGVNVPITSKKENRTAFFDTSLLTIIFIGAFPGIEDIKKKRLSGSKKYGFSCNTDNHIIEQISDAYIPEDLINFGIPREFIGRFDTICMTNPLTLDDLYRIITESEISPYNIYKRKFAERGCSLRFTEEALLELSKQAIERGTGARGIKLVLNEIISDILYRALANNISANFLMTYENNEFITAYTDRPLIITDDDVLLSESSL